MKMPVRLAAVMAVLMAAAAAFWLAGRAAPPVARHDKALSRPLMAAVHAGDAGRVRRLLKDGAPPDARQSDPPPRTWFEQLADAVLRRRPRGGDIDNTALVTAVQAGRKDIALLL